MTKPLELTIFPRPRMKAHHRGPAPYLNMETGDLTSEHAANMLAGAKHLAEAELCAEYESARCDAMVQRATGSCWAPLGETWSMKPSAIHDRAQTLLRFAAARHYYEEQE